MGSLQGFLEAHNLTSEALLCDSRLLSCCHVALLSHHLRIYLIAFALPYAAVALLTMMLATQCLAAALSAARLSIAGAKEHGLQLIQVAARCISKKGQ